MREGFAAGDRPRIADGIGWLPGRYGWASLAAGILALVPWLALVASVLVAARAPAALRRLTGV